MPTYDYACNDCPHTFEYFQSMSSDPLTTCPQCQGKLRRLFGTGGALIFKGSGFYCTDYKKAASPDAKVERAKEASKQVKESSPPPAPTTPSGSSSSSTSAA